MPRVILVIPIIHVILVIIVDYGDSISITLGILVVLVIIVDVLDLFWAVRSVLVHQDSCLEDRIEIGLVKVGLFDCSLHIFLDLGYDFVDDRRGIIEGISNGIAEVSKVDEETERDVHAFLEVRVVRIEDAHGSDVASW